MRLRRLVPWLAAGVVIGIGGGFLLARAGDREPATSTSSTSSSTGTAISTTTTTGLGTPFSCVEYQPLDPLPDPADPRITEASGIVESAVHPGVFWVHNDSGDEARVFGINGEGETVITLVLPRAEALDIEDIAYGVDTGGRAYIYLADVGDNSRDRGTRRPAAQIFRVVEPRNLERGGDVDAEFSAVTLGYERDDDPRPPNVEAFLVDPLTGDLVILQKNLKTVDGRADQSKVWVAEDLAFEPWDDGAEVVFRRRASATTKIEFPNDNGATGADISLDGTRIIVRNPKEGFIWPRDPAVSVAETFAETPDPPCVVPVGRGAGEAVAWRSDGVRYVTISEGANSPIDVYAPADG